MWILPLLGYLGSAMAFAFMTIAIATGLYYISELIEEHTVTTKRIISRTIQVIIAIQTILFLFDGLPLVLSLLSIASHALYALNLRCFPLVTFTDPVFLAAIPAVILNHLLWFRYFQSLHASYYARPGVTMYDAADVPNFKQVASFFGIMVWLVPFMLFISLSANDHVLPTMTAPSVGGAGEGLGMPGAIGQKRSGMFKAIIDGARDKVTDLTGGIQARTKKRDGPSLGGAAF